MNDSLIRTPRARRWGARVSAVTGIAVVGVVATSGIALACHAIPNPDISKTSYSCSGDVHYQVDSWSQDTKDKNATNPKVRVEIAVNGGLFTTVAEAPVAPATPITGVWHSPVTVTSAVVRATPEVPWSGGDTTKEVRSATVALINGPCVALPAASITPVSCTTGNAGVTLTNTGTRPATITVTGTSPAFSSTATVPAAGTTPVAVPVTEGSTSTVSAVSGATTLATQSLARSCTVSAPSSVISADCTGFTALLDNSASNVPVSFTVVGPTGSANYVVAAGNKLTTPSEAFTDGQTYVMSVSVNGKTIATKSYTAACAPVAPVVPDAPVTPAAPVTPVVPDAPVTPAAPVTPVVPDAPVTPSAPVAPVVTVEPISPVVTVAPAAPVVTVEPISPLVTVEPITPAATAQIVTPKVEAVTLSRTTESAPATVGASHQTSVRAVSLSRSTPVVQPTGQLAFTGANHLGLLVLSGLGLLVVGSGAVLFGSRRTV